MHTAGAHTISELYALSARGRGGRHRAPAYDTPKRGPSHAKTHAPRVRARTRAATDVSFCRPHRMHMHLHLRGTPAGQRRQLEVNAPSPHVRSIDPIGTGPKCPCGPTHPHLFRFNALPGSGRCRPLHQATWPCVVVLDFRIIDAWMGSHGIGRRRKDIIVTSVVVLDFWSSPEPPTMRALRRPRPNNLDAPARGMHGELARLFS